MYKATLISPKKIEIQKEQDDIYTLKVNWKIIPPHIQVKTFVLGHEEDKWFIIDEVRQ